MSGTKLYDKDGNHALITSDGKLMIDGSFTAQTTKYRPAFEYSDTDISLSKSNFTGVLSIMGETKLDCLDLLFDRKETIIQIEVDGVIIFEEELKKLKDYYKLKGGDDDD